MEKFMDADAAVGVIEKKNLWMIIFYYQQIQQ